MCSRRSNRGRSTRPAPAAGPVVGEAVTFTSARLLASNPRSVRSSFTKLVRHRPPTNNTTKLKAICAATSGRNRPTCVACLPPDFSASAGGTAEACRAGASPNRNVTRRPRPPRNTRTRQSEPDIEAHASFEVTIIDTIFGVATTDSTAPRRMTRAPAGRSRSTPAESSGHVRRQSMPAAPSRAAAPPRVPPAGSRHSWRRRAAPARRCRRAPTRRARSPRAARTDQSRRIAGGHAC